MNFWNNSWINLKKNIVQIPGWSLRDICGELPGRIETSRERSEGVLGGSSRKIPVEFYWINFTRISGRINW